MSPGEYSSHDSSCALSTNRVTPSRYSLPPTPRPPPPPAKGSITFPVGEKTLGKPRRRRARIICPLFLYSSRVKELGGVRIAGENRKRNKTLRTAASNYRSVSRMYSKQAIQREDFENHCDLARSKGAFPKGSPRRPTLVKAQRVQPSWAGSAFSTWAQVSALTNSRALLAGVLFRESLPGTRRNGELFSAELNHKFPRCTPGLRVMKFPRD